MAFIISEDVLEDLAVERALEQEEWEARQQMLQEDIWADEEAYWEAAADADLEWEDFQDFEPLHDEYPF